MHSKNCWASYVYEFLTCGRQPSDNVGSVKSLGRSLAFPCGSRQAPRDRRRDFVQGLCGAKRRRVGRGQDQDAVKLGGVKYLRRKTSITAEGLFQVNTRTAVAKSKVSSLSTVLSARHMTVSSPASYNLATFLFCAGLDGSITFSVISSTQPLSFGLLSNR